MVTETTASWLTQRSTRIREGVPHPTHVHQHKIQGVLKHPQQDVGISRGYECRDVATGRRCFDLRRYSRSGEHADDNRSSLFDQPTQAFEAPNMELDLRRKCIRILRRVCGAQTILPRSCVLSREISKEGDIPFASGRGIDGWRGLHSGSRVRIKAFRVSTAGRLSKIKEVRSKGSHMLCVHLTTRGSVCSKKS